MAARRAGEAIAGVSRKVYNRTLKQMKKYKLFTHNTAPAKSGSAANVVDGSARETSATTRNDACATEANILMIDDEPINMEVVQAYLEDAGYINFITTSDSTCAMDIIRQKSHPTTCIN